MAKKDDLKSKIARTVLEEALPYLAGWIQTLGEMGRPTKKGKPVVDPRVRVQAATKGVDFVTKFIGEAAMSDAGADLLAELSKLASITEGYEDAEPTAGGTGLPDPLVEGEDNDME